MTDEKKSETEVVEKDLQEQYDELLEEVTLKNEELEKLGLRMEQTKKFLSTFANIKGIEIWCSLSEDPEGGIYWVSIRSKRIKISDVARKYNGGGHDLASGAKINSIDELEGFIKDLDDLIK